MNDSNLTIGTRGSALALAQAEATEAALRAACPGLKVLRQVISTLGDRRTDVPLSEVAKRDGGLDKGVFTKELEIALAAGEIAIAVHSLKDVPTVLAAQFEIAGTLPRAGVRDVLIARAPGGLDGLKRGATVGTSSVRRAMQLRWLRPDLEVVDLRGNVPTRLGKVAAGTCDAIMLAEAGLGRLGHTVDGVETIDGAELHFSALAEDRFYPAAGQGAIGLEIRGDDELARRAVAAITDEPTFVRVRAEREFLRLLEGGCHTPIGVSSCLRGDHLSMAARVFPESGGEPRSARASGAEPLAVARELFDSLS